MNTQLLVTVKQAGEALSLSGTKVYELAADGKLEKAYIGPRNFRITWASVEAFAASLSQDPIEDIA